MRYKKAIEIFDNRAESHVRILTPILVIIERDYQLFAQSNAFGVSVLLIEAAYRIGCSGRQ